MNKKETEYAQKGGAAVPPPFDAERVARRAATPPAPPPMPSPTGKDVPSPVSANAGKVPPSTPPDATSASQEEKRKARKEFFWVFGIFMAFVVIAAVVSGDDDDSSSSGSEPSRKYEYAESVKDEQGSAVDDETFATTSAENLDDSIEGSPLSAAESVGADRKPFTGDVFALPTPHTLVNDYACVFSDRDIQAMEDSLRALAKHTSNQIVVVTVTDLKDEDPTMFAAKLGDKWGVGQKKIDNGVVILIKPKTDYEKGKVAIAPGRGLEGALPDVFCHRIIDDKMIPCLKDGNDYTAATWAALDVIIPVCRGEYNFESYEQEMDSKDLLTMILAWICMLCVMGPMILAIVDSLFYGGRLLKKVGLSSTLGGSWTSSGWDSDSDSDYDSDWGDFGGGSFSGGGASGEW